MRGDDARTVHTVGVEWMPGYLIPGPASKACDELPPAAKVALPPWNPCKGARPP